MGVFPQFDTTIAPKENLHPARACVRPGTSRHKWIDEIISLSETANQTTSEALGTYKNRYLTPLRFDCGGCDGGGEGFLANNWPDENSHQTCGCVNLPNDDLDG